MRNKKYLSICSSLLILIVSGWFLSFSASLNGDSGSPGIGIDDEKLGNNIPLSLTFKNTDGEPVALKQYVDKPTILSLVYFNCPSICKPIMRGVSDAVSKINMTPGKDYRILTVSFDPNDDPDLAEKMKKDFAGDFPARSWRFLTGKKDQIDKLTDAVGFKYKKTGKEFQHPAAMIILSPKGKITRYLYGVDHLPFDVKMAVIEARKGKTSPTINRVLRFCFSYDPQGQTYVFNILKVTGVVTIFFALCFIGFLYFTTKKYKRNRSENE